MAEGKIIQYTVRVNGQEKVIKNTQDWRDAQKEVNAELAKADLGSSERKALLQDSAKLSAVNKELKDDVKKANLELVASGKAAGVAEGSYDALNAELKALELEYKKLGTSAQDTQRKLDIEKRATAIRGDLDSINQKLGRRGLTGAFSQATEGIKAQFTSLGNFLKGGFIVGAVTSLINGLSQGIRQSTELFNTQAQAENKLLIALKGREDIQQRLIAQAAEFQSRTLFGDEEIINAQAFAVSMGLTEDQIGGVIEAAANLGAITGQDLQSAIKNIVRTFGGLKGELGELVPQVAALSVEELKAGKAVEVLNEAFGGQAEAAAKVGTGPLTQLKNIFGDILEVVGEFIVRAIDPLIPKLTGLSSAIFQAFDFLEQVFRPVIDAAGRLNEAFGELFGEGTQLGNLIGRFLAGVFQLIAGQIERAINFVSFLVEQFNEASRSGTFFGNVLKVAGQILTGFVKVLFNIPSVLAGIAEVLEAGAQNFVNFSQRAVLSAKILVEELRGVFDDAAKDRVEQLRKQREALKGEARTLGEAFNEGFNAGFAGGGDAVADSADQAKAAIDTVTDATKDQVSEVEILRARQKELNDQVLEAIVAGRPYGEQLRELRGITKRLSDAQEVLNNALKQEGQAAAGSLAGLRARQAALQKELELATDRAELERIATDLSVLDREIAERQRVIDEIRAQADQSAGGSLQALQQQISAIDAKIQVTTDEGELLQLIASRQLLETQLNTLQAQIDDLKADAERAADLSYDFILERDQAYRDELKRREEVDAQRAQQLTDENIQAIEAARDKQIIAALAVGDEREEVADRIRELEIQAELDILNERLRLAEVGSAEYLAIQRERAEAEVEIQQEALEQQQENYREYLDATLQLVGEVSNSIFQLESARIERTQAEAEEAINAEFDARVAANEGNDEVVQKLEEERAERLEQLEKESAQKKQQLAIKETIVNASTAAIKTLAELGFTPLGILALQGLAIKTAAEIAVIQSQTFAEGGFTGSSTAAPDRTGARPVGIVHEDEYVVPSKVLRSPKGNRLVRELEGMRLSMGYRPSGNVGLFQEGGFTTAEVIPPGPSQQLLVKTQVTLTEEQIDQIAAAVAAGARDGSRIGSSEALDNNNRQLEREQRLAQNLEF